MKKIIIVGHPQSGYEQVETLLNACGMATAQPSRREGYMPGQISTTLCKVHSASPLGQLESDNQIQQIEAGPVWHGMALDLMLGNLEQPFWGWADPQSIYLLNYWRDLDPSITFILVYDRPHSVLTQASPEEAASLSPETLSQRTRNWAAYNAALLHFFHRNPQRCLLVHSQQVRESASSYLQQVRARIDAPWSERMEQLSAPAAPPATDTDTNANANADTNAITPLDSDNHDTCQATPADPVAPPHNALALFVADALLRQHPTTLQLYEELQAVANLPLADGADRVVTDNTALHAWLAMSTHQQRLQTQTRLADTQMGEINELNQRLSHNEALAQQKQQLVERLSQAQQSGQQENELLLTQLHQVQEELERQHLQTQQQTQQATQEQARLAAAQAQANQRAAELSQQAEQLKQQLAEKDQQAQSHAAQARMSQAEKLASEQENELLLTQLHQVQEELERHYLANQEQAKKVQALLHTDKLAAERQQHIEQLHQQLAAQTQQATEKTTQLSQQAELLKKQLAEKEQLAKTQQQQAEQLKQQLAEKERQAQAHAAQLQAQLLAVQAQAAAAPVVDPALEQENELLLTQLHQVQEELERYYLEGQEKSKQLQALLQTQQQDSEHQQIINQLQAELQTLKAAPAPSPVNEHLLAQLFKTQEEQERRFHAAIHRAPPGTSMATVGSIPLDPSDRVRQQLSYRLGSTLITQSRTITGWLGMPVALVKTTRQFRRDQAAKAGHPPPAPYNAHDKQMAEQVKQHLSYRLGTTLIAHSRSPIGWVKMPFALRREVKDFRSRKRG